MLCSVLLLVDTYQRHSTISRSCVSIMAVRGSSLTVLVVWIAMVEYLPSQVLAQTQRVRAIPDLDGTTINVHPLSFGDTNIVATVPLRSTISCVRADSDSCVDCISPSGVQLAAAFHYAIEIVNQRNPLPRNTTLGGLLVNSLQTCSQRPLSPSTTQGLSLTEGLITENGDNFLQLLSLHREHGRILGTVDLVDLDDPSRLTIEGIVYVLLLFSTPEILLSSPPGTTIIPDSDPLMMRFEPPSLNQVTALAVMVQAMQLERIVIVYSGDDQFWAAAASSLQTSSVRTGACVAASVRLPGSSGASDSQYLNFANQVNALANEYARDGGSTAFLLLTTMDDGLRLFNTMIQVKARNVLWLATEPWQYLENVFDFRKLLHGMIVVADRTPPGQAAQFMDYFESVMERVILQSRTATPPSAGDPNGGQSQPMEQMTTQSPAQSPPPAMNSSMPGGGGQIPTMPSGGGQMPTQPTSNPTTTPGIIDTATSDSAFSDIPVSPALAELLAIFAQQQVEYCDLVLARAQTGDTYNSFSEFVRCRQLMSTPPRFPLSLRVPFLLDAVALLAEGLRALMECNIANSTNSQCRVSNRGTPSDAQSFVRYIQRQALPRISSGFQSLQFSDGELHRYELAYFNFQNQSGIWDMEEIASVSYGRTLGSRGASSFAGFVDFTMNESAVQWPLGTGRPRSGICEPRCGPGSFRVEQHPPPEVSFASECCWTCARCAVRTVSNVTNQEACHTCAASETTNNNQTACLVLPIKNIHWSDTSAIAVLCANGVIFAFTLFVVVIFIKNRTTPVIRSSSFELSLLALSAIGLQVFLSPVYLIQPSNVSCQAGFSLLFTIYTLLVSCLLMKTYKIWYIFQAKKHLDKSELFFLRTTFQVLCICVLTGISVVMVIIISVLGQVSAALQLRPTEQLLTCSETDSMFFIMVGYTSVLTFIGLILAFKVRKLPARFNDAHFLMITFVVSILIFIFLIIVRQQQASDQDQIWFPISAALWSFTALSSLFVPKVYIIVRRPEKNKPVNTFSHSAGKSNLQSVTIASSDSALKVNPSVSEPARSRNMKVSENATERTQSVDFDDVLY